MQTIAETAEIVEEAILKQFGWEAGDSREFVHVIDSLILHLRARLDTDSASLLEKVDSTRHRLKAYMGEHENGKTALENLQAAFADWSLAKRVLVKVGELPYL